MERNRAVRLHDLLTFPQTVGTMGVTVSLSVPSSSLFYSHLFPAPVSVRLYFYFHPSPNEGLLPLKCLRQSE